MTYDKFCEYFYKAFSEVPLSAQVQNQNKTIFHLKMELAKLKKQVQSISEKGD